MHENEKERNGVACSGGARGHRACGHGISGGGADARSWTLGGMRSGAGLSSAIGQADGNYDPAASNRTRAGQTHRSGSASASVRDAQWRGLGGLDFIPGRRTGCGGSADLLGGD